MASIRRAAWALGRICGSLVLLALGGAAGWSAQRLLAGQLTSIHAGPLLAGLGLFVLACIGLGGGIFVLTVPRRYTWRSLVYWFRSCWALWIGLAAVAEAALGVLVVAWATHGQTLAAYIGGGVALVLPIAALVQAEAARRSRWAMAGYGRWPEPRLDADLLGRRIGDQVSEQVGIQLDRHRFAGLSSPQLTDIADRIARRVSQPIAKELGRQMGELQGRFNAEIAEVIQKSIEASVLGPPLVNFTGFLVVGLRTDDDKPARNADGEIRARAGGVLTTTVVVIRDEEARGMAPVVAPVTDAYQMLYLAEPISIDGGRSATLVEFDAVADSPTLQPMPHRRSVQVEGTQAQARVNFVFRIPERDGRHDVWLQLYQGGRLIQAVAVRVRATVDQAPVNT